MGANEVVRKVELVNRPNGTEQEFSKGYTAHPLEPLPPGLATPPTDVATPRPPAPATDSNGDNTQMQASTEAGRE